MDTASKTTADELRRRGVVNPQSNQAEKVKMLEQKIAELESNLENERAMHFRTIQDSKNKQQLIDAESNKEIASQSRKVNELRVEYSEKLKAVEKDLEQRMADQIGKRKGAYYEKYLAVFSKHLEQDMNTRQGEMYDKLHKIAEHDVCKDIQNRQGHLYEQLCKDVRATLLKESVEREEQANLRVAEVEHNFYAKYQRVLDESKESLRKYQDDLRLESEKLISNHQQTFAMQIEQQLKRVNDGWLERWAKREEQFQHQVVVHQSNRSEREGELSEAFSQQTAEVVRSMEVKVTENEIELKDLFSNKLVELRELLMGWEQKRQDQQRDHVETFQKTLHELQLADNQARETLEVGHAAELANLKAILDTERERFHCAMEDTQAMHAREINELKGTLDAERERLGAQQASLESSLKEKYTVLADSLKKNAHDQSGKDVANSLDALANHAMKQDVQLAYVEQAIHEATQAALKKYEDRLVQAKRRWEKQEQEKLECTIKVLRDEHAIEAGQLRDSLEAERNQHQQSKRDWLARFEQLESKSADNLAKHTELSDKVFQEQLEESHRRHAKLEQDLQAKMLEQTAVISKLQVELDTKVQDVKNSCRDWSIEYAKEVQAKYTGQLRGTTQFYQREIEKLQTVLSTKIAQWSQEQHEHTLQLQNEQLTRYDTEQKHREEVRQLSADKLKDGEMEQALKVEKHRLVGLWKSMDIDAESSVGFLTRVFANATYTPQLLSIVKSECERLTARVPLIQLATRREYIKYQIKCIHKFPKDVARLKRLGIEILSHSVEKTRDVLLANLAMLTSQLIQATKEYEAHYSDTMVFKDRVLLDELAADTKKIPEMDLAVGAVASDAMAIEALRMLH